MLIALRVSQARRLAAYLSSPLADNIALNKTDIPSENQYRLLQRRRGKERRKFSVLIWNLEMLAQI